MDGDIAGKLGFGRVLASIVCHLRRETAPFAT